MAEDEIWRVSTKKDGAETSTKYFNSDTEAMKFHSRYRSKVIANEDAADANTPGVKRSKATGTVVGPILTSKFAFRN